MQKAVPLKLRLFTWCFIALKIFRFNNNAFIYLLFQTVLGQLNNINKVFISFYCGNQT